MKAGRTLQELAMEIERQNNAKADYVVQTRALTFEGNKLVIPEVGELTIRENAHGQIANRLKIPKAYYDRMRQEAPELLSQNVNHWFQRADERRMVRTLDGDARAFLSDRYRVLDNFEMMSAVLPVLQENRVDIVSTQVTEQHMYIKVLFPDVQTEVKGSPQKNDVVQAGIVISNSEVGSGSLRVEPLIYRLVCTNGMIANTSMKKYHVGRGQGTSFEDVQELLRDETRMLTDKAFWMQVQDVVRSSINRDIFLAQVERLSEATEKKLEGDPVKAVELVRKQFGFTQEQGSDIMRHLIEGGDLSQWGVANAVTRTANDQEDYEAATHLERMGGRIIDLSERDWKVIAKAA